MRWHATASANAVTGSCLVARPRTVEDLSVWKEPHEVARAVAARVLQRYGKAALVGRAREAAETWEARLESGTV